VVARDFLYDDRAARPTLRAVVVGVHLAALFIEWPVQRVMDAGWESPGSVLLIPAQPREQQLPAPPTIAPIRGAITYPPLPGLAPLDVPSEAASSSGSTMAPPDWKQSGTDAAADAARDNYRALGPPPKEPEVKLPPPPFGAPPRHKSGEIDEDGQRNPILWLGEHCFLRPENFAAQPGDPLATAPMTFCSFSIGKQPARGDLFEHLRKQPPVP
jgi:hypothetical protein